MSLKTIVKNAGWLGLIQILNYLVPFLTLPVVTRAFGPVLYGILAAFNAYGRYVYVIVGYGFDFTGLRAITRAREDHLAVSKTVSTIFSAQILLGTFAVLFLFIALPFIVPSGADHKLVGLVVLLQSFATVATPQWVFLGLEQIRGLALAQFAFRISAAVLIISFDSCTGRSTFVCKHQLRSLYCNSHYFPDRTHPASHSLENSRLRRSCFGHSGRRASFCFEGFNQSLYVKHHLFVAFVLGPAAAGAFALADRVRTVAASVIGPLNMAVYPFIYRVVGGAESDEAEWTQRVFFLGVVALAALISIALFVFAPLIIWLLAGDAFHDAILVLRIIAFLPLIITLSNRLGYQALIPLGMDRQFMWIVISAALFGVAGIFILMNTLGLAGAAFAMLTVEIYVTIAFAIAVKKRKSILSFFLRKS